MSLPQFLLSIVPSLHSRSSAKVHTGCTVHLFKSRPRLPYLSNLLLSSYYKNMHLLLKNKQTKQQEKAICSSLWVFLGFLIILKHFWIWPRFVSTSPLKFMTFILMMNFLPLISKLLYCLLHILLLQLRTHLHGSLTFCALCSHYCPWEGGQYLPSRPTTSVMFKTES